MERRNHVLPIDAVSYSSVTNTIVGYIFGQAKLCSFCSPEHENFHKSIDFLLFFLKKSKSRIEVRKPKIYACHYDLDQSINYGP